MWIWQSPCILFPFALINQSYRISNIFIHKIDLIRRDQATVIFHTNRRLGLRNIPKYLPISALFPQNCGLQYWFRYNFFGNTVRQVDQFHNWKKNKNELGSAKLSSLCCVELRLSWSWNWVETEFGKYLNSSMEVFEVFYRSI